MKFIDSFLDRITMYRVVVYALLGYVALAVIFAFLGKLSFSPTRIVISLGLILIPAFIADRWFSKLFAVPTNSETWVITALIIFFVLQPASSVLTALGLVLAGVASSASKFIVAWHNKHIFNPAAFGIALVSLTALGTSTWWIGNSAFWPFTLLIGLIVVRKIRRMPLFVAFIVVSVAVQVLLVLMHHQPIVVAMKAALLASPLLFLGTFMLTEPATMPPRRREQIIFAALVAVLYVGAPRFGPLVVYPEVALLIGNLFAFGISPKLRVGLRLESIQRISGSVYNYIFVPDQPMSFIPGQYMEWTLPVLRSDSRGNRRTFTIASSPTEPTVQLGIKYFEPASAYKMGFSELEPGAIVYASQLAGDFTIDPNGSDKLAFIAGGIGITPFRSMVKYLTDMNIQRDIVLLYVVPNQQDLAYMEELRAASTVGIRVVPIITRSQASFAGAVNAKFSQQLLASLVPDYADRNFYISGPSKMVDATKAYLQELSVANHNIKTDHFSGY